METMNEYALLKTFKKRIRMKLNNALICKQMDGYHLIVGKNPAPLMFQFSFVVQKVKGGGASALNNMAVMF